MSRTLVFLLYPLRPPTRYVEARVARSGGRELQTCGPLGHARVGLQREPLQRQGEGSIGAKRQRELCLALAIHPPYVCVTIATIAITIIVSETAAAAVAAAVVVVAAAGAAGAVVVTVFAEY